jgi:uncharacterized protein YecE (DUF72 family)
MAKTRIGTSGWTYDGWRGRFYPPEVPKKCWLRWYASQFSTTEINGSFYRTPSLDAVRRWSEQAPDDFVFAWKASKFITHWKRLSENSRNSIELTDTRLKVLGRKAGPVLFQFPSHFDANHGRLAVFLKMLPSRYRYAFEFRHASWYEPKILDLLRESNVALCLTDHHQAPAPLVVTAGHVYIRGHGPGGHYKDNYRDETLRDWSRSIRRWRRQRREVFVYFDNDQKCAAPEDAQRLMQLVEHGERSRNHLFRESLAIDGFLAK